MMMPLSPGFHDESWLLTDCPEIRIWLWCEPVFLAQVDILLSAATVTVIASTGSRGKAGPCHQPPWVTEEPKPAEGRVRLRKPTNRLEIFCKPFPPFHLPPLLKLHGWDIRTQSVGRSVTGQGGCTILGGEKRIQQASCIPAASMSCWVFLWINNSFVLSTPDSSLYCYINDSIGIDSDAESCPGASKGAGRRVIRHPSNRDPSECWSLSENGDNFLKLLGAKQRMCKRAR